MMDRISTSSLRASALRPVLGQQAELARAQTEVATGRLAEPGLVLGGRTARLASLDATILDSRATIETNGLASAQLGAMQDALSGMKAASASFRGAAMAALGASTDAAAEQAAIVARGTRASIVGQVNARLGAVHLFAGNAVDRAPLADPDTAIAARDTVSDAFIARFGHPIADPASATIDPVAMGDFLDDLEAAFAATEYEARWVGAEPELRTLRQVPGQAMTLDALAHDPAFRDLVLSTSIAEALSVVDLANETRAVVLERVVAVSTRGDGRLAELAGRIGSDEERLARATARLETRTAIAERAVNGLTAVDGLEAATRVQALVTQLEASLAITARVSRLSLLNHL